MQRAGGQGEGGQPPLADRAAAHQRSARCAADADPLFRVAVSIWTTSRSIFAVWPLSLEPRRSGWPAWPSRGESYVGRLLVSGEGAFQPVFSNATWDLAKPPDAAAVSRSP